MKIRKILPLLAVAVVALFALASCDQLLENIYPDQTNSRTGNTINVDVQTWYAYYSNQTQIGKPLIVQLLDSSYNIKYTITVNGTNWSGIDPINSYAIFTGVADGTYYANAFYDINGTGIDSMDYYNSSYYYSSSITVSSKANVNATVDIPFNPY